MAVAESSLRVPSVDYGIYNDDSPSRCPATITAIPISTVALTTTLQAGMQRATVRIHAMQSNPCPNGPKAQSSAMLASSSSRYCKLPTLSCPPLRREYP
jgi:hypothetical protein